MNDDYDFDIPPGPKDLWVCQECGHKFFKPWPKVYRACKCPKCKSNEAMPQGM